MLLQHATVPTPALEQPSVDAAASRLECLCPELQLSVYNFLGYQDAIRLSQVNRYFHATVDPQAWPTDKKAAFVEDAQHWWRYNMFYMSSSGRQGPAPYIRSVLLNSNGCACFSCFRVFPKSLFSNSQTERVNAKSNQSMTRFCLECGIKKEKYRCGEVIIRDRVDKSEKCFTLQTSPAFLCGFCKSFRGFRYDGVCASCYEHDDQCGSPFNTDGTFSPECLGSHQT